VHENSYVNVAACLYEKKVRCAPRAPWCPRDDSLHLPLFAAFKNSGGWNFKSQSAGLNLFSQKSAITSQIYKTGRISGLSQRWTAPRPQNWDETHPARNAVRWARLWSWSESSTRSPYESDRPIHYSRLHESRDGRECERSLGPVPRAADLSWCARRRCSFVHSKNRIWVEHRKEGFEIPLTQSRNRYFGDFYTRRDKKVVEVPDIRVANAR